MLEKASQLWQRGLPAITLGVLAGAILGCATEPTASPSAPAFGPIAGPMAEGSLAPGLLVVDGRVLLTWLERAEGGATQLRAGRVNGPALEPLRPASWVVAEGQDLFVNWADRPALHALGNGELVSHWLRRLGSETYAYGVEMLPLFAGSAGSGVWLHDDTSPTEHGFVTSLEEGEGARFFWLDGRAMEHEGPMSLRTAVWQDGAPSASEVLDERVCECCPTDAARTTTGPLVVYRDRSETEVRDIFAVRQVAGVWQEPQPVAVDGWEIPGCPVNGPAVAADGDDVVVVWFTGADNHARVLAAVSSDAGASFSDPMLLDDERPVGRVDVTLDEGEVWATWLARAGGEGHVAAASFRLASPGTVRRRKLADSQLGRKAGYPRLVRAADGLYLAHVSHYENEEHRSVSAVRVVRVDPNVSGLDGAAASSTEATGP